MARIEIERRPDRNMWGVLLALLLVIVIAFGVWYLLTQRQPREVNVPGGAIPEEPGIGVREGTGRGAAPANLPDAGGESLFEA